MLRSFHIPVIIGATVLTTLGVVTLQVYVVGVTGVRGVYVVGICKVYENDSHNQVIFWGVFSIFSIWESFSFSNICDMDIIPSLHRFIF